MPNHHAKAAAQAKKLASEIGIKIVKNQISPKKYDYQLVKEGEVIKAQLQGFTAVLKELESIKGSPTTEEAEIEVEIPIEIEETAAALKLAEIAVQVLGDIIEETEASNESQVVVSEQPEPVTEQSEEVKVPEPVKLTLEEKNARRRVAYEPQQIELSKVSHSEVKDECLKLLGMSTARQVAKWAKQQGLEDVDLCYKAHWAVVLEKAKGMLVAA